MPEVSIVEAIRLCLHDEMAREPRVVVLGEDVGRRGGVFRATAGLFESFGPQRVIDTPLAESAIIGVAVGAAVGGLIPVAEIQFADFLYPGLNQLINEAAKLRYRSAGAWTCPLVVRVPYGIVHGGGLYHGQSVEAMLAHAPGLRVLAPSMPADAYALLQSAIRGQDPVVFLEPKRIYAAVREPLSPIPCALPSDAACVRREGDDVTAVAYGFMLHRTLAAADRLAADGIAVEVLDLRSLRPIDGETILRSVRKTGRLCVIHEDNAMCGYGAEIAALAAERALFHLDAPVCRIAAPEVPGAPFAPELEDQVLPTVDRIAGELRRLAEF